MILIIVVLLLLAWPMLKNALAKRDLTRTMHNGRELYLAAFRMATDGAAKYDKNRTWPGDYPATTLAEYCGKLVLNGYVQTTELERLLSAPGATCNATMSGPPATLMLSGKSAWKIYKAKGTDPTTAIFAASSNYVYDTPLNPNAVPFGDVGFVVVRKGGDARIYKSRQATPAGYDNDVPKFQDQLGTLPGTSGEKVAPGDGGTALIAP